MGFLGLVHMTWYHQAFLFKYLGILISQMASILITVLQAWWNRMSDCLVLVSWYRCCRFDQLKYQMAWYLAGGTCTNGSDHIDRRSPWNGNFGDNKEQRSWSRPWAKPCRRGGRVWKAQGRAGLAGQPWTPETFKFVTEFLSLKAKAQYLYVFIVVKKTSLEMVAVRRPRKYPRREQWK